MTPPPPLGLLAQVACLLEATARKPGNVHRFHDFDDLHYLDFALSALAVGPALESSRTQGVGPAILAAVRATRTLVSTNTNLGMILLLAPLSAVAPELSLSNGIEQVLSSLTVDDAQLAYEAIRLAQPGGLATAPEQDIHSTPSLTLRETMKLAAHRDSIALQYANGFHEVLHIALPLLNQALDSRRPLEAAIIDAHLALLAAFPDTLILRKLGAPEALEASQRARQVLDAGWPHNPAATRLLDEFDLYLRARNHDRNPGATADLVAAALFAGLRDGTIPLPVSLHSWAGPPSPE